MRVGIPIWNGRVSPVLDTAERVAVVDTEAGADAVHEEVALEPLRLPLRAARIAELRLDLLVCGAVSRPLAEMLAAAGVRLEPWISGEVKDVLGALTTGQLDRPRYRMPGCCGGRGRGGGLGQGRGRGRSHRGRTDAQRRNR